MKTNDTINVMVMEGYVRKYLVPRPSDPIGPFVYQFGFIKHKTTVTKNLKYIDEHIPTNVFVYNEPMAEICRSLKEGDHIVFMAELVTVGYEIDGEMYELPEIKVSRMLKVEKVDG